MSEVNDATIVAALRRQMTIAVAREVTASSNLANLDTPGYRAREVAFDQALDRQMGGGAVLAATNPRHFGSAASSNGAPPTRETDGLQARRDGNTVQLDRELIAMAEASGDFAKAQTALAAKFRLVRYAINEGR
jgi:flagellar basal-body rod protein FlgB